jgi:hypothetical protein
MIISKLQGGLGNQMFQWAYAKHLSKTYETNFYLDISFYNHQIGVTKREYDLTKFPNIIANILPNENELWNKETIKPIKGISDNFIFNELQYDDGNHFYLDGFWQTEKYFKGSRDVIIKELSPSEDVKNKLLSKYTQLGEDNISLHIRRTDYIAPTNLVLTIQPIEYYQNAIEFINEYDNIFIFSDDIQWCKENLSFNNMVFVEGNDDVEDIWIMSLCNKNVIANSSFSWWGAWLNDNDNKVVVAPKDWFINSSNLSSGDIIPKNWIKI